jgi:dihydropteroate synthase
VDVSVAEAVSFYFLPSSCAIGGTRILVIVEDLHIGPEYPVRIMGVINLSPESFYKESTAETADEFLLQLERMVADGADIIDIGGASTAPKSVYGTSEISKEEEIRRISVALGSLEHVKKPISIDTTSSEVAEIALDLGASIVNDVSGLQNDQRMSKIVADREVPVILMAMCDPPCGNVQKSLDSLTTSLKVARDSGIDSDKIILDPGFGFGKQPEVDISMLRNLDKFVALEKPLLVGISRKAFIGHILQQGDPNDRLIGSLAATAIAVANGADMIRTHDVSETRIAVRMAESIRDEHNVRDHYEME